MKKRTRRAVFYSLLALFPLIGAIVVLYAQGWRFDFATWRAEKVGVILVRPYPADASITLNGKPVQNQSGFLSQTTAITGLFPGNYALSLRSPGYRSWNENAPVDPSLVTEFGDAVLVPDAPATTTAGGGIAAFEDTSDGIVLQMPDGAIMLGGDAVARGALVGAADGTDGAAPALPQAFLFRTFSGSYERYDLAAATATDVSAPLARAGARAAQMETIALDPYDAGAIIAIGADGAWRVRSGESGATLIARPPRGGTFTAALAPSPSFLAWSSFNPVADSSAAEIYDQGSGAVVATTSALSGKTVSLGWISPSLLGILQNDGALYEYDLNARATKRIAGDVRQFAAAPDGSAIAALEKNSLEILPLTDAATYHRFNLPDAATALQAIWYGDSAHLFIAYPGSVSFLDLEDAGLRNFISVAKGNDPIYNSQENVLYLLNGARKLEQFDFPS